MEAWLQEMEVLFNRHGFSAGQRDAVQYTMQGDATLRLDPVGQEQSVDCGIAYDAHFMAFPPRSDVAVLSSPYGRAVETFDICRPYIHSAILLPVQARAYLGEQRYGGVNGLGPDQIAEQYPDFLPTQKAFAAHGERYLLKFPGVDSEGVRGESQYDVYIRTKAIIGDLYDLYQSGIRHVIVNSHGTSGRAAQMNVLGMPCSDEVWRNWPKPNNCQIDRIFKGERTVLYPGAPEPASSRISRPQNLPSIGNGTQ